MESKTFGERKKKGGELTFLQVFFFQFACMYVCALRAFYSVGTSLYGNDLAISKQGNNMQVNGHRIETADLLAYNGLVHIINGVLLTTTDVGGGGNTVSELIGAPNAVTSTEKAAQDTSSGFNPMCTRNLAYNMALVSLLVSCLLLL